MNPADVAGLKDGAAPISNRVVAEAAAQHAAAADRRKRRRLSGRPLGIQKMSDSKPRIWLEVQSDALCLFEDNDIIWKESIAELTLVGEYTTNVGPWAEDYFFVFGFGRPPKFYEVPLGMGSPILSSLSASLGFALVPSLCNNTDWRSRVLWPPALEGHSFLNRSVQQRPHGVLNRVKDSLAPRHHVEFDPVVAEYLGCSQRS
jgi:hypothetical protein